MGIMITDWEEWVAECWSRSSRSLTCSIIQLRILEGSHSPGGGRQDDEKGSLEIESDKELAFCNWLFSYTLHGWVFHLPSMWLATDYSSDPWLEMKMTNPQLHQGLLLCAVEEVCVCQKLYKIFFWHSKWLGNNIATFLCKAVESFFHSLCLAIFFFLKFSWDCDVIHCFLEVVLIFFFFFFF